MQGKYKNWLQYGLARTRRALLRAAIRPLVTWEPVSEPRDGYTIVVGCNTPLAEMLAANLHMLGRQRLANLDRIVVVFDEPKSQMPFAAEEAMRRAYPELPLEFAYYTRRQARVCRMIGFAWVNCWLSWCIGIAAARSRYCLLHDFDAMLIDPEIVESRYEEIRRREAQYCRVRNYIGNGIEATDGLVVTFEMMFDLEFLRRTFHPIDLYNSIGRLDGRTVDFDTFLYPQRKAGISFVLGVPEQDMVHPSQVICQFSGLMNSRDYVPPETNNLLMIPYFLFLAGKPESMTSTRRELELAKLQFGRSIQFFGRRMNLSRLSDSHARWLEKQAFRLEQATAGRVRQDVSDYFGAIKAVAGIGARSQNA